MGCPLQARMVTRCDTIANASQRKKGTWWFRVLALITWDAIGLKPGATVSRGQYSSGCYGMST